MLLHNMRRKYTQIRAPAPIHLKAIPIRPQPRPTTAHKQRLIIHRQHHPRLTPHTPMPARIQTPRRHRTPIRHLKRPLRISRPHHQPVIRLQQPANSILPRRIQRTVNRTIIRVTRRKIKQIISTTHPHSLRLRHRPRKHQPLPKHLHRHRVPIPLTPRTPAPIPHLTLTTPAHINSIQAHPLTTIPPQHHIMPVPLHHQPVTTLIRRKTIT